MKCERTIESNCDLFRFELQSIICQSVWITLLCYCFCYVQSVSKKTDENKTSITPKYRCHITDDGQIYRCTYDILPSNLCTSCTNIFHNLLPADMAECSSVCPIKYRHLTSCYTHRHSCAPCSVELQETLFRISFCCRFSLTHSLTRSQCRLFAVSFRPTLLLFSPLPFAYIFFPLHLNTS